MPSWVDTQLIGRVLVATLSRPPVNALDETLIGQLHAVLDKAIADAGVSVLHIRSSQRVFCAGADLALIRACFETAQGPDEMTEVVRHMQRLYERLEVAPLATVAEIGGAALGGGLELGLACDFRVAALDATLGLPEAALGLLPGAGGTQRLTRLCGPGVAKRLILGAEVIGGAQALQLGIVQWALPRGESRGAAGKHAQGGAGRQQALHRGAGRPRSRWFCRRDRRNTKPLRPPRDAPQGGGVPGPRCARCRVKLRRMIGGSISPALNPLAAQAQEGA